jgi:tetratricopeptide (TPR) repeat protein
VHERLPEALKISAVEVRPSWEGTLAIQKPVTEAKGLLFGSGPNSFAENWALYKPQGVNATVFWNLDFDAGVGTVPTPWVTVGMLGVIAWILLLLGFLWTLFRIVRTHALEHSFSVPVILVISTGYLVVFHIVYAPSFALTCILFILLGLLVSATLPERSVISIPMRIRGAGIPGYFAATAGILLVMATSANGVRALASETFVSLSVAEYNKSSDIDRSLALVQRAISFYPNDRAHRAAVELGILKLSKIASENPTSTEAQQALKDTLATTIEHGLSAVTIAEGDYQNWLTVANLYQELAGVGIEGAYEQALNAYGKVREKNPTNPVPFFRAGQLEIVRGNSDDAIALLNAAVTLKADLPAAHYLLSQLHLAAGRLQQAVDSAGTAVQLVPQDPLAWYNLGVILYQGRSFAEARTAFEQAVSLRSDYANALFMLGMSHAFTGNNEAALATLEKVRVLNPENTTVDAVIKNLQAGKDPLFGLTQ